MQRRFLTLDVFTSRRLTVNPLAVVLDAQGLDTAAMQAIAREFNLPETVFVLPPDHSTHRARLKIFTPATELPFAGHPTVGAAVALARIAGGGAPQAFVLEETIGPVACTAQMREGDGGYAVFALPQLPERKGELGSVADVAAALSLAPDDIDTARFAPARWSAGVDFPLVGLTGRDAVRRAQPEPARFASVFGVNGPAKAFIFCDETENPAHTIFARMFAPGLGVAEDPATGSAAAAFAGLWAAQAKPADGSHNLVIEQGYGMGRPSLMALSVTIAGGALTAATIGGDAVVVSEGRIEA
jgi:trans-2,3-dihydro-3-hydroxyanthranilate isomerase